MVMTPCSCNKSQLAKHWRKLAAGLVFIWILNHSQYANLATHGREPHTYYKIKHHFFSLPWQTICTRLWYNVPHNCMMNSKWIIKVSFKSAQPMRRLPFWPSTIWDHFGKRRRVNNTWLICTIFIKNVLSTFLLQGTHHCIYILNVLILGRLSLVSQILVWQIATAVVNKLFTTLCLFQISKCE